MSSPFSRTLRAVEADGLGRPLGRAAAGGLALGLWLLWAVLGRVAVYVEAAEGRLEVDQAAHVVQADADGLVVGVHAEVGEQVRAGDVLVALEADDTKAALVAVEARIRSLTLQREGLVGQLARATSATEASGLASSAALAEARAQLAEAEAARVQALAEAERVRSLLASGAATTAEADRTAGVASERAAAREAASRRVELLGFDGALSVQDRETRGAELQREIASIDALLAAAEAERSVGERALARRNVVAPIDGVVAERETLRPGAVVRRGEAVASIVPPGDLVLVAAFAPGDAIGRVQPGQRATLRLDGFHWIEYGPVAATVRTVASEPRDGRVRVELEVSKDTEIPLQHGLPGAVHVEVERVSPARLLLRAIGSRLTR